MPEYQMNVQLRDKDGKEVSERTFKNSIIPVTENRPEEKAIVSRFINYIYAGFRKTHYSPGCQNRNSYHVGATRGQAEDCLQYVIEKMAMALDRMTFAEDSLYERGEDPCLDDYRDDLVFQLKTPDDLDWDYFLETAWKAKVQADRENRNMRP